VPSIHHFTGNPEILLEKHLRDRETSIFSFEHAQYYLPESPAVTLLAVLLASDVQGHCRHFAVVTERLDIADQWLALNQVNVETMVELAQQVNAPLVDLFAPWSLAPVHIAKPWGQEIWFTGIEKRGQSAVTDGLFSMPLPWLLALSPARFLGVAAREPALLKILDPLPEEVFGDLYFELHEEKREVYVVTHVDRNAWPDGRGAIRFGFDQVARQRAASDEAFRQQFLSAVADYEQLRRAIDRHCDEIRREEGVGLNEPVDAATLKRWLGVVPAPLLERERQAREAMNAFTHMLPLREGDVVKVPCLTPHALQHGVRTVEFQTPVYERKILAFAQKVLTQDHWDTSEAVELMSLEAGSLEALSVISQGADYSLEQVVRFADFEVQRLNLAAGASLVMPPSGAYRLVMVATGDASVNSHSCSVEDALLLPAGSGDLTIIAHDSAPAVILICLPR